MKEIRDAGPGKIKKQPKSIIALLDDRNEFIEYAKNKEIRIGKKGTNPLAFYYEVKHHIDLHSGWVQMRRELEHSESFFELNNNCGRHVSFIADHVFYGCHYKHSDMGNMRYYSFKLDNWFNKKVDKAFIFQPRYSAFKRDRNMGETLDIYEKQGMSLDKLGMLIHFKDRLGGADHGLWIPMSYTDPAIEEFYRKAPKNVKKLRNEVRTHVFDVIFNKKNNQARYLIGFQDFFYTTIKGIINLMNNPETK